VALTISSSSKKGPINNPNLRLVIIYYLSVPDSNLSKDDIAELVKQLQENGVDVRALDYVKKVREVTRMTMMSTQPAVIAQPQPGGEWTRGFGALGSRVSQCMTLPTPANSKDNGTSPRRRDHRCRL
jgi:hypothetical protein